MQFKIWENNYNFYNFTGIFVTHFISKRINLVLNSPIDNARARVIVEFL